MTTQFDFSNDQWDKLASIPYLVGMAVAKAENSGFLGSVKESRTLLASIESQPEGSAASSLIAQAATTDVSDEFERFKGQTPEALATDAVEACTQLTAVMAAVAEPAEVDGYKQWVLDVAWTVAQAAKEHGQGGQVATMEADQ